MINVKTNFNFSAEEASIDPFGNVHFLVDYTGDVLWVPPAHFKVKKHYPRGRGVGAVDLEQCDQFQE